MIVGFWSPFHGQTATTTTTALMALYASVKCEKHLLIAHTNGRYATLEQCFGQDVQNEDWLEQSEMGLSALKRLTVNGRLESEMIHNYTKSLYGGGTIDLLPGLKQRGNNEDNTWIKEVLIKAVASYDMVFVDVHSGENHSLSQTVLQVADMIVVCLNQNRWLVENFNQSFRNSGILKEKRIMVHLALTHEQSRMRPKNLEKSFGYKGVIETPYDPGIMMASNQQELLNWYMRQSKEGEQSLRSTIKILERSGATLMKNLQQLSGEKEREKSCSTWG